jgi:hypothetical protein
MENNKETSFDKINIEEEVDLNSCGVSGHVDVDGYDLKDQVRKRFDDNTRHRGTLVYWVMWIVSVWLFLVICVVSLSGLKLFTLSESVLITILTTTTVNILGLPLIILRGLFKG